ncbi:IgGFc-binding protein [bacterium]|nr:IgGFc-binding protein [bacterium]
MGIENIKRTFGLLFASFALTVIVSNALADSSIDSLWFNQETACNDSNIVEICYQLSGDPSDISLELSSDGGATWETSAITLFNDSGDLGPGVLPGLHCFDWLLNADLPDFESRDFQIRLGTYPGLYEYWLPYVVTYTGCTSGYGSILYLRALYDSTAIQIDFDNDGVVDTFFVLNTNQARSFSDAYIIEGTHIFANLPLSSYYYYYCSNHGIYEDGTYSYALYPSTLAGSDYAVPPADFTTVFAIENNTTVNVDNDYSGSTDLTFTLNSGENNTFSTITHPAHITTVNEKPIIVVNSFHSSDYYSTTCAYNLLPVTLLGSEYYAPEVHGYSHTVISLLTRVEVVAPEAGTNVTINGTPFTPAAGGLVTYTTENEISVLSDRPVAASYISDVYATDPWGSHVDRHYMYAFQLFPEALLSRRHIIPAIGSIDASRGFPRRKYAVVSFTNGNLIELDVLDDGSVDSSYILNRGVFSYFHEEDYTPTISNFMSVNSSEPLQVTYSDRGWWAGVSEKVNAWLVMGGDLQAISYASGPVDSRSPEVNSTTPGFIPAGEMNDFSWTVDDLFWHSGLCELYISGCGIDEHYTVPGSTITWFTPDRECPFCTLIVAARDSFCNWGADTVFFSVSPGDEQPHIDMVWFYEETLRDSQNLVYFCYRFSDPDSSFALILPRLSGESGLTWTVPLDSLLDTLSAYPSPNVGDCVSPGEHCFQWVMSEDLPDSEACSFRARIELISGIPTGLSLTDSLLRLFPRGGPGGGGLTWDGEYLYVGQFPDTIFKVDTLTEAMVDTYIVGHPVGMSGLEDLAYLNNRLYISNSRKVFRFDLTTGTTVDSSANLGTAEAPLSGITAAPHCESEEWFIYAARSNNRCYKINALDLTLSDSLLTPALPDSPEGLAYANGFLWCLLDNGTLIKINLNSGAVISSIPMPYYDSATGGGPEGLTYDGQNFWYAELGATDRIYKAEISWYVSTYTTSPGCLDSRNPLTLIDSAICGDTLIAGENDTIYWQVWDDFVFPSSNCSLYYSLDEGRTFSFLGVSDNDSQYIWSPIPDTFSIQARIRVALYDSFGNYSQDTSCVFSICRLNEPPLVLFVEFHQRTDGSKIVDISYQVDDPNDDSIYISVQVSRDGGTTWDIIPYSFVAPSDTGWVTPEPAITRNIIWDMGSETDPCFFEESDIMVRIIANDHKHYICE